MINLFIRVNPQNTWTYRKIKKKITQDINKNAKEKIQFMTQLVRSSETHQKCNHFF
jgi:hypothetical protein